MSLSSRKATVAVATAAACASLLALPANLSSAAVDPPASRLAGVESLLVENPTFAAGTSRWRAGSKHDRLIVRARGHGDAHAVEVRTTADGKAVLQTDNPVVATGSVDTVYDASVWVRSRSVGSSIQLRLGPVGSVAEHVARTVAGNTATKRRQGVVVADRMRWYRLDATYRTGSVAAPLALKVVAQGLRGQSPRFAVDDVRLHVRKLSSAPPSVTPPAAAPPTAAPPTPRPPTPTSTPTPPPVEPDGALSTPTSSRWMSGASGTGVASGAFGSWRGTPVPIAGTWNDNAASQVNQWTLQPGFEYGAWQGDLDVAVGAIYKDRGESWRAAASGAYDSRWRSMLTNITRAWGTRPGTVYLRFAHEFNGDWYPWSVTAAEAGDFRAAWRRFRALQREIAPRHKLVFCPNSETTSSGLDWRTTFPGADQVDVMSVDHYNQYPFAATVADFDRSILSYDATGAPRGLERHRQFAASQGLPFAVSEWSSNSDMEDSPAFVTAFRRWLTEHAGAGAGQVLYEIHFNVDYSNGRFQFFPSTRQPNAAAAYQHLW